MSEVLPIITKYLVAKYKYGARGEGGCYDCFGLARVARVELYGRQMMSSRGGEHVRDLRGFTACYYAQIEKMIEIKNPVPGAVLAVLKKGKICMHVALVVHDINNTGLGLHVLDINLGRGACLIPLFRFLEERRLRTIKYYDDKSLSESA